MMLQLLTFLVITIIISSVQAQIKQNPEDVRMDYPGDIRLAGFFPIHKYGGRENACGEIQKEDGIQPLEAMLYILDEINRNPNVLPNITLGAIAVDSCDNPIRASNLSLPLLKGFLKRNGILESPPCQGLKNNDDNGLSCDNIVGVLGPQTSAVSLEIASLGRLLNVPLVSYLSTSVTLCQREKYPTFFRTVPSDKHQAKAIVELLKRFKWNYVSFVHSDSEYGSTGYEMVKSVVKEGNENVCLADPITIYNNQFDDEDYKRVVETLIGKKNRTKSNNNEKSLLRPRVVIVFADRVPAGKLLKAAKELEIHKQLLWIGSDAWASRESVVEDREEIVEGAIAIQPLRRKLKKYNDYFKNLFLTENTRNPWFNEYLQVYHNCSYKPLDSKVSNCKLADTSNFRQQQYIHFIRDAVYAYAHAIHNLHKANCKSFDWDDPQGRMCDKFKERIFKDLVPHLKNVTFKDPDDENFTFKFDFHNDSYSQGLSPHDGPPRYSIINFAKTNDSDDNDNLKSNNYDWENVGTYVNGIIDKVDETFSVSYKPKGLVDCSRPDCDWNEIKIPDTEDQCCWHCLDCGKYKMRMSEYECKKCNDGWKSEQNQTDNTVHCVLIEETFMNYSSYWAISAMCVAGIGIVLTFAAFEVFWLFWGTPFVKAAGRDLSLILLCGNFCSFLTTFVVVTKPTSVTCGLMRFCVGFCYTVCYASVVVKTNRVWRIFTATGPVTPRFTSSFSSTMIVLALVIIEAIINTVWLLWDQPVTKIITVPPDKRILVCNSISEELITSLIYPFFLILIATVYAFLTRKVPGGFNETKFIFFANTLTCIHWFAYVPLYLASTDHFIKPFVLSISLSVSGYVQMGCLIFPKLYTVVFKPNNNTKEKVLKPHRSRATFTIPETPPNSVAVGIADGALLGPYQHMMAPLEVKVEFPETAVSSAGTASTSVMTAGCATGGGHNHSGAMAPSSSTRRHPTWSHELHLIDRRPRSRSLSVSRSTQTREELEQFREMKKIKFTVHQCDAVDDREVKEELNECTSGTGDGSSITTNNILKVPNNTDL